MKLTFCSYNIRHGLGMDGRLKLERTTATLYDIAADIICLQEVDVRVPRSYRKNQPAILAKQLSKFAVFGPALKWPLGALYGNAILSRFPLHNVEIHSLPSGPEPRVLLEAHAMINDVDVAIFCTHWGLDEGERIKQAERTMHIIRSVGGAAVLAGDLNAQPAERPIQVVKDGGMVTLTPRIPTIPADCPIRQIDHIFGAPGWEMEDGYTMPSLASDHQPLVAELTWAHEAVGAERPWVVLR